MPKKQGTKASNKSKRANGKSNGLMESTLGDISGLTKNELLTLADQMEGRGKNIRAFALSRLPGFMIPPKTPKTVKVNMAMSHDLADRLKRESRRTGKTEGDIVSTAIIKGLTGDMKPLDECDEIFCFSEDGSLLMDAADDVYIHEGGGDNAIRVSPKQAVIWLSKHIDGEDSTYSDAARLFAVIAAQLP